GWKTVSVNVSDMAAMGCRPRFFLLNLHVTGKYQTRVGEFMRGVESALESFGAVLVGGDTTCGSEGPFAVAGTIIGSPFAGQVVSRAGALPGQILFVTGEGLGGSFPRRHLEFTPRVEWCRQLMAVVRPGAMIDISDGLLLDASRIAAVSACALEIDLFRVPIHADAAGDADPLSRALSDGEDFELLFTLAPEQEKNLPRDVPLSRIGRVVAGQGIFGRREEGGVAQALSPVGYEHGS
ncbi:MAG: thiamine-monophosphate kinase, partial [Planctomycetes bacterium]|nr:thiamine-monophosphate kinase [Planctomycetota bacterium]